MNIARAPASGLLLVVVVVAAGCPPPPCEQKDNLLDNAAWSVIAPDDDPFAPTAPKPLILPGKDGRFPAASEETPHNVRVCEGADVYVEDLTGEQSLTVNTNICGWATAETTLLGDVAEGAPLFLRLFYFEQFAPGVAEAHLNMTVDGGDFWSLNVSLPAPSDLIAEDVVAPFAAKKGARVVWHVDNHGVNTWNLFELSTITPVECPKPD